jgi:hypothetical protein
LTGAGNRYREFTAPTAAPRSVLQTASLARTGYIYLPFFFAWATSAWIFCHVVPFH